MNRHELAKLRLKQLLPSPPSGVDETLSDQFEIWLRQDVVPVTEELLNNPAFRRIISAIGQQLFGDDKNERRVQLNGFADALTACAQAMVAAATKFGVLDALADQDRTTDENWLEEEFNRHADRRCVVEKMAMRPWFDLVDGDDFWTPRCGLFLRDSDALLTRQFRRELTHSQLLGDHVTELMLARVGFWTRRLSMAWNRLQPRLGERGEPAFADLSSVFARFLDVEERHRALVAVWRTGSESRLRNACMVLLQTYVAYHSAPQLAWLGFTTQSLTVNGATLQPLFRRQGILTQIKHVTANQYRQVDTQTARLVDLEVILQIGAALEDVAAMYQRGVHADDLIKEARAQYKLVVVVRPRMVFWRGRPLKLEWDGTETMWNLMLHLAVQAEGKLPIRDYVLSGVKTNRDLSVRKSHLMKFLAGAPGGDDLAVLIEKRRSGPCYLDIAPETVRVLDLDADEWTVDVQEFFQVDAPSAEAES
ncbi:MAG: hypothetical protein J0M17_06400 [Planctomycetes bacterium]|nr:hypothetical protein [Planctomycetota bacterium]